MLLGLTGALSAHHSVFYFMSLEEGFYFNLLVIPCVQFHIAVPGISSLTTEVLPFLSFQAAATYIRQPNTCICINVCGIF